MLFFSFSQLPDFFLKMLIKYLLLYSWHYALQTLLQSHKVGTFITPAHRLRHFSKVAQLVKRQSTGLTPNHML